MVQEIDRYELQRLVRDESGQLVEVLRVADTQGGTAGWPAGLPFQGW